jgi:hypothetical protein
MTNRNMLRLVAAALLCSLIGGLTVLFGQYWAVSLAIKHAKIEPCVPIDTVPEIGNLAVGTVVLVPEATVVSMPRGWVRCDGQTIDGFGELPDASRLGLTVHGGRLHVSEGRPIELWVRVRAD